LSDKKTEQEELSEIDPTEQAPESPEPEEAPKASEASDDPTVRISELEEELATARENELRAVAEQENARRRADQEVQKARKFALERLVNDLLPVVDNLERAMQLMQEDESLNKAIFEGIELTHKEFTSTLKRQGVEVVEPQGEPFNPEHHQAISMQEQADAEPNSVLQVVQKGYLLNGRLLRPAMVIVSKSAS
jgi:molecular chaperone GrpE